MLLPAHQHGIFQGLSPGVNSRWLIRSQKPSDSGRDAISESIVGDIVSDHGSSTDDCSLADSVARAIVDRDQPAVPVNKTVCFRRREMGILTAQ
jgi:hypothetical protein